MNKNEVAIASEEQRPFGGLVPANLHGLVLAEIVADPFSEYTPANLAELTGRSAPRISEVLKEYEQIGLLQNVSETSRPRYAVNGSSKRIFALTLLSLAVIDDDEGEGLMDRTILDYVSKDLGFFIAKDMQMVTAIQYTGPNGPTFQVHMTSAQAGSTSPRGWAGA